MIRKKIIAIKSAHNKKVVFSSDHEVASVISHHFFEGL